MVTSDNKPGNWPKWLNVTFTISGCLFVIAAIFLLNNIILQNKILGEIEILKYFQNPSASISPPQLPLLLRFTPSIWVRTLAVSLAILVILQAISTTISQGINLGTVSRSVVYGLIALFLIYTTALSQSTSTRQSLVLQASQLSLSDVQENAYMDEVTKDITPPSTNNFIPYITAITGLITAFAGFYGQFISAQKLKLEVELVQQKMVAEKKKPAQRTGKAHAHRKKQPVRKNKDYG